MEKQSNRKEERIGRQESVQFFHDVQVDSPAASLAPAALPEGTFATSLPILLPTAAPPKPVLAPSGQPDLTILPPPPGTKSSASMPQSPSAATLLPAPPLLVNAPGSTNIQPPALAPAIQPMQSPIPAALIPPTQLAPAIALPATLSGGLIDTLGPAASTADASSQGPAPNVAGGLVVPPGALTAASGPMGLAISNLSLTGAVSPQGGIGPPPPPAQTAAAAAAAGPGTVAGTSSTIASPDDVNVAASPFPPQMSSIAAAPGSEVAGGVVAETAGPLEAPMTASPPPPMQDGTSNPPAPLGGSGDATGAGNLSSSSTSNNSGGPSKGGGSSSGAIAGAIIGALVASALAAALAFVLYR